ncbi:FAD-dependent oxidoreductase [uncultured Cellulomonas sp.]|uniref:NAD(P)/FAD-dependent oxidoreductase n=1 Tax=uncultured Cellulomonas sp. TaxID=189682 RepID=UPI0028E89D3C|nr:FAD-dependent oxidoreductase [uncultured Cellulomonas sp.]
MRRVVLLGGGYVTLHAYGAIVRRLRGPLRRGELELVVVSADTVHNFHGFTGEVVAGLLPIGLTQTPLTEAMPRARVLHARVTRVDLTTRTVHYSTSDGADGDDELAYDALVVGTGAREPLDAVDGLAGRGLTLRGPGDLAELLQRVRVVDGPVVVVGGGLAGVELSAALAARVPHVVLVQSADRVVPALHAEQPRLAARCATELARLGVDVRTGVRVVSARDGSVTLSDGSVLGTHVVLATTGQSAVVLPGLERLPRDERGRLVTTRELLVAPDVWSAGDAASVAHPRSGTPVTANALWAIKAGDQVGRNVARALTGRPGRRFRYLGLGQAASFGVGRGVADLYGVPLTGWLAWAMRVGFFLRFMPTRSRAVQVPGELLRRARRAEPVRPRVAVAP